MPKLNYLKAQKEMEELFFDYLRRYNGTKEYLIPEQFRIPMPTQAWGDERTTVFGFKWMYDGRFPIELMGVYEDDNLEYLMSYIYEELIPIWRKGYFIEAEIVQGDYASTDVGP